MKTSKLLQIALLLALITGYFYYARNTVTGLHDYPKVGQRILQPEILNDTAVVKISTFADTQLISFSKANDRHWVADNYFKLPIDTEKLTGFTDGLYDNKIKRFVSDAPEALNRLELDKYKISFHDSKDKELFAIHVGKDGEFGGTFIQYPGEKSAYLSDRIIEVDIEPFSWVKRSVLDISESEIKQVTIKDLDINIHRDNPDGVFYTKLPTGSMPLSQTKVSSLIKVLLYSKFKTAAYAGSEAVVEARKNPMAIELLSFGGDKYSFEICENVDLSSDESAPQKTDGYFIFHSCNKADFYYDTLHEKIALLYPDFIAKYIPNSLEQLLETEEIPESEKN